jgi:hypothetical protein
LTIKEADRHACDRVSPNACDYLAAVVARTFVDARVFDRRKMLSQKALFGTGVLLKEP